MSTNNPPKKVQNTALAVTRWIGSPSSLAIHTVIFIAFFIAVKTGYIAYDEMLLVLTTIVSLEAIYLSIFIQMTINYTTQELAEVGEDIEEIQEDIGEIQEDVDELQEDVEDIVEDDESEKREDSQEKATLDEIQKDLRKLLSDVERLKNGHSQ
jgi:septal ring factor EnvC (AmiA/AmiB activator)